MKKKQFIFVMGPGRLNKRIFSDLYRDERVIVLDDPMKTLHNRILKSLRKIHLSSKVNKIVNLPFKRIWKPSLEEIDWQDNIEYYIIFQAPGFIQPSYLIEKAKKYNIKYIIYEIDIRHYSEENGIKYWDDILGFEYIFTLDPGHAEQYGLLYSNTFFSMLNIPPTENIGFDLYLASSSKGRLPLFLDVFEGAIKHNISSKYRITGVGRKEQRFKEQIIYNQVISYDDVVRELVKANCVLEVPVSGQVGATLTYCEAIAYNKKLLTTNKNVVNLPFYNPEYIKVFEKPEEIDWEWVKERTPVEYGYDGRFSPTHLIDKIIELEDL